MLSGGWGALSEEVGRWRDAGRSVEFWWRDDDAAQPHPGLSRLLALAQRASAPLALAVVPLLSGEEIFESIGAGVSILQHGTDHRNRAAPGEKKTEFPTAEPRRAALARLIAARERLAALAGARFVPVLAPPWNRLPAALAPRIAEAGFCGLTQYGARSAAVSGLRQVNTHVDIVAWRSGRGFAGAEDCLASAVRHLARKRAGTADPDEATGWLTHHAVLDEAAWAFLERLFETTRGLQGVVWRRAAELFHHS